MSKEVEESVAEDFMGEDPARTIIEYFGGVRHIAHILRVSDQAVYRTLKPYPKGSGGFFSVKMQLRLLHFAECCGIDLVAHDFYDGSRLRGLMTRGQRFARYCVVCKGECAYPQTLRDVWWMACRDGDEDGGS